LETLEAVDEVVPDLEALRLLQVLVTQSELDSGFECLVENPDTVAG
jgi:hypothetical protein